MISRGCLLAAIILLIAAPSSRAQSSLFYLEAQGIAGYSSAAREAIYYSMSPMDPMQKPSVGFDWLRRLSGAGGDIGIFGLQVRSSYNHEPDREFEAQVYNAWFRYKAGFANLWVGHDRPALGLSSYFDTHGLLLPTLAMMGWGFDRDWGVGFSRDLAWGNLSGSWTSGSGMPLYFRGNHLGSARISKGVLERENYSVGLSAAWGDILETMGYDLLNDDPYPFHMASIDLAYLWTRYESRIELIAGERMDEPSRALLWRFGVNLLEENRLKLEVQPVIWKDMGESSFAVSAGASYQATADLALRSMYQYSDVSEENKIVFQVYYYKRM
jgi:opacity protein-like surface antigen